MRAYPNNKCISFLYDLDDDNTIDIIEYRRWDEHGNVSAPVRAYYDKNSDKEISCDEVVSCKDPLPDAGACPPKNMKTLDGV